MRPRGLSGAWRQVGETMGGEISTAVGPETWTGTAAWPQLGSSNSNQVLPFLIDAARKGATWADPV